MLERWASRVNRTAGGVYLRSIKRTLITQMVSRPIDHRLWPILPQRRDQPADPPTLGKGSKPQHNCLASFLIRPSLNSRLRTPR